MRKWVALLGGAMFFVLFLSMYMVVDQLGRTPSYQDVFKAQVDDKLKAPIQSLERDMAALESNLKMSGNVISRMQNTAEKLHFKPQEGTVNDNVGKTVPPKAAQVEANLAKTDLANSDLSVDDGCIFSKTSSGTSADVKMLDMFDMMPFDNIDGGVWKQGWDVQYSESSFEKKPLQVFVVPHSHNDPGWIKTVDQYFNDQTRHILDNVVDALADDKRRKFIWAETSYFSMWWETADENRKQQAKKQIGNGQLEIVTGAWVMSDEANTHYYAILDQMIEGHEWLRAHLGNGVKPVAGWAIDPFGHTPTMAYLLNRMGFKSMLIQRTHYQVKKYLAKEKSLEFMWRQNWDHKSTTDMFCHMMPFYSYDVPHTCGPDPKICCQFDFRRLPGGGISCPWRVPPQPITSSNIKERAEMLLDQYKKKAQLYKTNVVFAPLGDDFRYEKTFETDAQFTNYQKLFDYINSHPELNAKAQFGTLSDYFEAVWKATDSKVGTKPEGFPTLSGDFYTYADRDDHYWSGYYTSRPFYKNLDRVLESHHRAAEVLYYLAHSRAKSSRVTAFPSDRLFGLLVQARRNLGLFQHHDGITGTAKDHVVVDYGVRLLRSLQDTERVMSDSAHFLLNDQKSSYKEQDGVAPTLKFVESRISHDSLPVKEVIIVSATPSFVVLYNSLTRPRQQVVSLHVSDPAATVTDGEGKAVPSQVNPVWDARDRISTTKFELLFLAEIPALGLARFSVQTGKTPAVDEVAKLTLYKPEESAPVKVRDEFKLEVKVTGGEPIVLENNDIRAEFDSVKGLLRRVTTKGDGVTTDIAIQFVTYGTKGFGDRSGAYLFLPDGPATPHAKDARPSIFVTKGKVVQEVRVTLPKVVHVVKLFCAPGPEGKMLDIQNRVDIRSQVNKELVMRVKSSIANTNREYYTDLNGFQMQKRRTMSKIPLQANFYPMPAMAFLQDEGSRLTVLSASPLGVAGLEKGQLEIVLDRRLYQDDNRGLGQGVTDNKLTQSNFRLILERFASPHKPAANVPLQYPSLMSHRLSQHMDHPVYTFVVPPEDKGANQQLATHFTGLKSPWPCDIFLVTLRTLQDGVDPKPKDNALMVLHRKGYECNIKQGCLRFTSGGKVRPREMFNDRKIAELKSTSLSMLHVYEDKDPDSFLYLEPMELYSYKIKLT